MAGAQSASTTAAWPCTHSACLTAAWPARMRREHLLLLLCSSRGRPAAPLWRAARIQQLVQAERGGLGCRCSCGGLLLMLPLPSLLRLLLLQPLVRQCGFCRAILRPFHFHNCPQLLRHLTDAMHTRRHTCPVLTHALPLDSTTAYSAVLSLLGRWCVRCCVRLLLRLPSLHCRHCTIATTPSCVGLGSLPRQLARALLLLRATQPLLRNQHLLGSRLRRCRGLPLRALVAARDSA